ncbi:uncharacterized protein LOC106872179 [Octopus bimaculoides]|uniref:Uncharacterized protein n=1 Tax=Octopus bimaculoides TaxID=37653 RepID=A0A0L8H9X4_OCTBM|nr:uncharacterized protein LOC106872179 [Octopus bimaculoides]XP_014774558.1 uncharacterized protein LOC106872179 [Octopus bimaculoides]|eukprot:XP_014774557.1 PREDICTED: uncharacterized protein LOC106872179 [Octopus bimaculoides]
MEVDTEKVTFTKKKARRSSFTPGRAKQFQDNKLDITCDIKGSLSTDLQLSELAKKCMKHAFNILKNEIPTLENSNICDEVEAALLKKINAMTEENVFHKLYHKERCSLNPLSKQLDSTINEYKSHINTVEEESRCWDELKHKTRKMVTDAELRDVIKLKNYKDLPEAVLETSENYLPAVEFERKKIQETINQSLKTADISVNYLQTVSSILQESAKTVHSQAEALQLLYAKNESKMLPNSMKDTPHKLLQRIPVSNETVQQQDME